MLALLRIEADALREQLLPYQLVVQVSGGVEVLLHVARAWREEHEGDPDQVVADSDQTNAHNTGDRVTLMTRALAVIPRSCRWLRWMYPLESATLVCYRDGVIESKAGGQQGCPLIGACHALVQRAIPESLGQCSVPAGCAPPHPHATASTDDRRIGLVVAGPQGEVYRAMRHLQDHMPGLGLRFSKVDILPAAPSSPALDANLAA